MTLSQSLDVAPPRPVHSDTSLFDRPAVLWSLVTFGLAVFFWQQSFGDVVHRLVLPDNDDAMRLLSVRDLIAGQGWFDVNQHRYLPPNGSSMHWSRLVDAPLAALILTLMPLLGERLAEGVVAALWPPAVFLVYLAILAVAVRNRFGNRTAGFALFIATQMATVSLYSAGRIDHHNVQATAMFVVALCLTRRDTTWRAALSGGAIAALSLAIGLETLPYIVYAATSVMIIWILDGKAAIRLLVGFCSALAIASLLLFAVQTSPRLWSVPECDALSTPWLLLTTAGGLGAVLLAAATSRLSTPIGRLAGAAALGVGLVALFAIAFPACTRGPFGALPEIVRKEWLERVIESMTFWRGFVRDPVGTTADIVPLIVAAGVGFHAALQPNQPHRRAFAVLGGFAATGAVITLAQMRGVYIGTTVVPVIAGWAFDRAVQRLREPVSIGRRIGSLVVALLLISRFSTVLVAGVQTLNPFASAEPAKSTAMRCIDPAALQPLERWAPTLVMAPVDLGPNMLLFTHHAIIAAPYHRNYDGIAASLIALGGSKADMKREIDRYRPGLLVLCPAWIEGNTDHPGSFARQLLDGARASWLEPLPVETGPLKVWRITG